MSRKIMCTIAILACTVCTVMTTTSARAKEHVKPEFELMHLWLTPIEEPALATIRNIAFKAGFAWKEHRVEGNFYGVRLALAERVALGLPPTAVFWIGSIDRNAISGAALFRKIPFNAMSNDFSQSLRPEIKDLIQAGDGYTTLPLVIHLQNIAVINTEAFAKIGAEPPTSWSEFIELAPRLAAAGIAPISVSDERWLLRFLFLSIFVEGLSKPQFTALLTGNVDKAQFIGHATNAMSTFRSLKQYANSDSHEISWSDAVQRVINGSAALTITGDFAAPAIRGHEHIVCRPPPGNRLVMWSFDVLAFPNSTSDEQAEVQQAAFRAFSSKDALKEFGQKKGGIPVIRDLDPLTLDHCSQQSLKTWEDSERVLLTYNLWRLQLNSMASLAQHVWTDDTLHLENVAAQLYDELAHSLH